jgi:uncharacterized RDD family membrane protein YckC
LSDYGSVPPPPPPPGGFEQPSYGAPGPSGPPLAVWIQRVGAFLIDDVIVVPFLLLAALFMPKADSSGTVSGGFFPLALLLYAAGLAAQVYNRWYLGGQGQSLGKKVLGLTLVSESTGRPIGMGMAFVRDLAHFVDGIICYIGYLFPLWDPKRQTIADKIVSTVVLAKA